MKHHTEQDLELIEQFKENDGQLFIRFSSKGKMQYQGKEFEQALKSLIEKGVVQKNGTGGGVLRWSMVRYELKYFKP